MSHALTGRTALVTGGSRGIGAGIARELAREGANVVITYRKSREQAEEVVAELAALGAKALAVQADQSVPQEASAAVEQAAEFLGGRIDVLVNSAGVAVMGTADQQDPDLLDAVQQMLATNVMGTVVTTHTAAKYLPEGGRVILVGSSVALRIPTAGAAEYAASKAALDQLGRGWARDFGPRGITVNVVQPAAVDTDMNPANGPYAATQAAMTALGRYGTADEVAKAVAFFAGEDAAFITGSLLTVDGGWSI
ncbi:SDR family NAD(P)-dependent oxidoreductase [Catellatospora citrea]|uniref:3-oxoacyl-ACP reductase n=1 Tax=Catellatospora citrea TaxID=53366 RepID=A0A8J3KJQ0_9ACTN|nr:SDR family oxidoreductase [Catellatospora citrea]RKE10763.1 3-oxoacyl-[acyl-carrier protein] reductase [Catellatospora citrea]GIG01102.1 3-oxoacyl-ACP reductase [Catellatospora citrea]